MNRKSSPPNLIQRILSLLIKKAFLRRITRINHSVRNPTETQKRVFDELIHKARHTLWGFDHGYSMIRTHADFIKSVPLSSYEDLFPMIDRMMKGEKNILWPGNIQWFSKSSGTTNARSKYIPVSKDSMRDSHIRGGKDTLALYIKNVPDTKIFFGKSIGVIGSLERVGSSIQTGDISAVMNSQMPWWVHLFRSPKLSISLMKKWEDKIGIITEITSKENITSLAGVPTWEAVLLERVLEHAGAKSIFDVWPNFELLMHGGVAFAPYRSLFEKIFGHDKKPHRIEIYNASEGFFAVQDDLSRDDMLLMLDYGIFYEFIPLDEYGRDDAPVHMIGDVEIGVNYVVVISTTGGLWRYVIGDTVRFTTTSPHRIKITGRTKHFINAFGEEVVIENAEEGLRVACEKTGASIRTFSVAPLYMTEGAGTHEWFIEFETPPDSSDMFMSTLDHTIREVNSDYDAKRSGDVIMSAPILHRMPEGSFYEWMKRRDKLGGQNKVPSLVNGREYADQFLALLEELA